MSEFCVIGSGISGATIANLLNKKNSVTATSGKNKIKFVLNSINKPFISNDLSEIIGKALV